MAIQEKLKDRTRDAAGRLHVVAGGAAQADDGVRLESAEPLHFDFQKPYSVAEGVMRTAGARRALALAEALAIVVMSVVAGVAYHALILGMAGALQVFTAVGLLAAVFFVGAMHTLEARQSLRSLSGAEALRDVTLVWLGTMLSVTFFAFSLKAGEALSRAYMLSFMFSGYFGILATRAVAPRIFAKFNRPTRLIEQQVLVIGSDGDPALDALLMELNAAGYLAPPVVRFNAKCPPQEWQHELRVSVAQVLGLARTSAHGEICISASGFSDQRLRDLIVALQVVPRAVRVVPSPPIEHLLHFPIRGIGALNSVELQKAPLSTAQVLVKRILDVLLGSLALAAVVPFLLGVAAAIRLGSRGPVLFRQQRFGHRGVPFAIFKFRTMTVAEDGEEVKQAQANDQRVTRVGRWLRKLSIDELPQLINVIRGDMSLVGPRPHAIAHDKFYSTVINNYEIRQHVKPGITGWAQVNGFRGETSSPDLMRQRVEFDIWYAKNASVLFDLKILLMTVVEVFRQRNAY